MKNIRDVLTKAKTIKKFTMAVAHAHDEDVLTAVNGAMEYGFLEPILFGDEKKIKEILTLKKYPLNKFTIINTNSAEESAKQAVRFAKEGKADVLMKGILETKTLLKEVVNRETGIREKELLSHASILSFPNIKKLLFITDGAMVLYPNVEQKIKLIVNALELMRAIGYHNLIKVGLVSAIETENPKLVSSYEAVEVMKYFKENPLPNVVVEGPFAVDNLISEEAARKKGIKSAVAGDVDLLVFPNLDSGNVFYKTSVYLANADSAGLILGAKVPIVLTSRADHSVIKLYSIALAGVYQDGKVTTN